MSLLTESVEIGTESNTGGYDSRGNPLTTMTWTPSAAWLEQTNSTENDTQQEQTTARMRVFLPLATSVEHTSLVRWGGYEWRVAGEPGRQPGGFVVEGFQLLLIERTEG